MRLTLTTPEYDVEARFDARGTVPEDSPAAMREYPA
jgi:hypothetical protein